MAKKLHGRNLFAPLFRVYENMITTTQVKHTFNHAA